MLATPHILTGAAVGKALPRWWVALPTALVSHHLLDLIPHLDAHSLFGTKTGGLTSGEVIGATVDALLGIALILLLVWRAPARTRLLWMGFAGVAIDFFDNIPPWGNWFSTWPGTAWLSAFHHTHQWNLTPDHWFLGFGTQLAMVGLSIWYLRRTRTPVLERTR